MSEIKAAKSSLRSTFFLIVGNLVSTIVSTLTIFIIARSLGPAGYGLYTLALAPVSIFMLFASTGVNTSITRNSAYYSSRNEMAIAKRMTVHGIEFLFALGVMLTLVSYLLAPVIAGSLLHRPIASDYVRLSSLAILGQVMLQCCISSFMGWHSSGFASLSNVVQSVVKAGGVLVLLLLGGLGVYGAIFAHVLSYLIAGSLGILFLYVLKLRGNSVISIPDKSLIQDTVSLIKFGIPSEMGSSIAGFASGSYIVIILSLISNNNVVGWYQAASNITAVITIVSSLINVALSPAFSSLYGSGGDVRLAFKYALKYTSYIISPIILFVVASSSSLIMILYGSSFAPAGPYLILLSIGYLPILAGLTTFTPFFNSVGKTKYTLWTNLTRCLRQSYWHLCLGNL